VISRTTVTVVALAACVALTACGSSQKTGTAAPATTASASASDPSATAGAGAGGGPSGGASGGTTTGSGGSTTGTPCVVGTWKTTGVAGALTGNGVNGTVKGGGGIVLKVAPSGSTTVTFDGMQPVGFTYEVGGGSVEGTFAYGGSVTGTMKLPAGNVTSGTWAPTGTVDFSPLTVTVDVTNPAVGKVADKQPLADFVGSAGATSGAAVDAQPLLRTGQFTCAGATLTIAPPAGGGSIGTWTLAKA